MSSRQGDLRTRGPSSRRPPAAWLLLVVSLAVLGCAHTRPTPRGDGLGPVIRVALSVSDESVTVGCARSWRIAVEGSRDEPIAVPAGEEWTFDHAGGGSVRIVDPRGGLRATLGGTLALYPDERGSIMRLGPDAYRGYFVLFAGASGLVLVNRLRLEDYVLGVVGNEIGRGTEAGLAALRAQAVAARTYAYIRTEERSAEPYDVEAGIRDQVYTGLAGESPLVERACRETAGEILHHDGRPAAAFYFSTCGGRTADAREAWSGSGAGHLRSVRDAGPGGDFCAHSRHHRWRVSWSGAEFLRIFESYYPRFNPHDGSPMGELVDVRVDGRGPSGRAMAIEVITTNGRFRVERDAIRWTLREPGPDAASLRSTYFDLDVRRRDGRVVEVVMTGRGYGHGVGMCQAGAQGMAEAGYDYRAILGHYFHDVAIRRLY